MVPTVPTTASQYAPVNVPLGMTRAWNAAPQSGLAWNAETM